MRRLRHLKRGSYYNEVARGTLQASDLQLLRDQAPVAIYRADDGSWHVRAAAEFDDGRYEVMPVIVRHVDESRLWAYLRLGWHAEYVGERGPGSTYMVSWMRAGDPVEPEEVKHGGTSQAGEQGAPTGTPT